MAYTYKTNDSHYDSVYKAAKFTNKNSTVHDTITGHKDLLFPISLLGGPSGYFGRVNMFRLPVGWDLYLQHNFAAILYDTNGAGWDDGSGGPLAPSTHHGSMIAILAQYDVLNHEVEIKIALPDYGNNNYTLYGHNEPPVRCDILSPAEITALIGTGPTGITAGTFPESALTVVDEDVPTGLLFDDFKIYTGLSHLGESDKLTFVDPADRTKVIVIDKPSNFASYSTLVLSGVNALLPPDSHRISIVAGSSRYTIESGGTENMTSINNLITRYGKDELARPFSVNSDIYVPAILEPGVVYTGITYDDQTNKLSFLDPNDPSRVAIVDKPPEFDSYVGKLIIG